MPGAIEVAAGAHTDVGTVRSVNEDAWLAAYPVYLVADGMGGHEAGDRASATVVAAFAGLVGRDDVDPHEVVAAIATAHRAVGELAAQHARGAGSTAAGVVAVRQQGEPQWLVFNIGDSRVYRLFGSTLEQVTVDHSVVQELVSAGSLAPHEAARHPRRNVITRAIGDAAGVADFWLTPIITGERLLLCTDGVSSELSDEALRAGLSLGGSAAQTAHALVDQAVARGGRDNATAVVVDVRSGAISARADEATGGYATSAAVQAVDADTLTSGGTR